MRLFNFCFRNSNGQWDNNDGQNYVFQLEKPQTELIVLEDEPSSIGAPRKLRKSYLWSKKIRLAVYKIITYLPKLISGNYKKKIKLLTKLKLMGTELMVLETELMLFGVGGIKTLPLGNVFLLRPQKH